MFFTPPINRSRDVSFIANRRASRRICINRPIRIAEERR
jgi:hypothetical protein